MKSQKIKFVFGSCFSVKLGFLFGGVVLFEATKGRGGNYRRAILIEQIGNVQISINVFAEKQWAKAVYELEERHIRDLKLFGTVPFLGFPAFKTIWVLERDIENCARIVYVGLIDINSDDPICSHYLNSFDVFLGAPITDADGVIGVATVHRNEVLGKQDWNRYGDISLSEIEEREKDTRVPAVVRLPIEVDLEHPLLRSIWRKKGERLDI